MAREPRESSFDELARGLASGSISRRKALKLVGAALVGSTLASLGIGEAAADDECKPNGKKCRKNKQCCSGTCSNGQCVCPTINCGAGTLNQNTCTCECAPANAGDCANNSDPNFQGCCPTLFASTCVPLGTVCSPPTR